MLFLQEFNLKINQIIEIVKIIDVTARINASKPKLMDCYIYKDTKLRRRRRKGKERGSVGRYYKGRQGASSKRANSDFPSRGWKILIGWQKSGSAEYAEGRQNMAEGGGWHALAPSHYPPLLKKACPQALSKLLIII